MLKRILSVVLVLLCLLPIFSGCTQRSGNEYYDYHFFAMDTYNTLRFAKRDESGKPISEEYLEKTALECESLLKQLELQLSAHHENSPLYEMNEKKLTEAEVSDDLLQAILAACLVSKHSDGAYDPTLGGLSLLWNIAGGGPVPSDDAIEEALSHTGFRKLDINGNTLIKGDPDTKIDLGGVGKGFAAEKLIEYLNGTHIPYGLISLGGNIGTFGKKASGQYKVGIKDPNDPNGIIGYLYLGDGTYSDAYLSVSGDYERYFEENGKRYHHILDPNTGYPAESGLRSAACISSNGAFADGFSTALFVMGAEKALSLYAKGDLPFEAILITEENEVILTDGLLKRENASLTFELTNENYTLRTKSEGGKS